MQIPSWLQQDLCLHFSHFWHKTWFFGLTFVILRQEIKEQLKLGEYGGIISADDVCLFWPSDFLQRALQLLQMSLTIAHSHSDGKYPCPTWRCLAVVWLIWGSFETVATVVVQILVTKKQRAIENRIWSCVIVQDVRISSDWSRQLR